MQTLRTRLLAALVAAAAVALVARVPQEAAGAPSAGSAQAVAPAAPRTVLLVRHAEKGSDEARDPALDASGAARAAELARTLRHAGVTHLFATEYRRTQDTLRPLADALGLEVEIVPAREPAAQLARLRALPPGAVALVAGHSNTVPGLVEGLGGRVEGLERGPGGPQLDESEYDRLWVVVLPPPGAEARVAPATLELRQ